VQNVTVDWREVWERKGAVEVDTYDLQTLLDLDGYDVGTGKLTPEAWAVVPDIVVRELSLRPGMRLLDVGCGAGALLWCLQDNGLKLFGVDYSAPLIAHARRAVPEATFAVAEALSLPFDADAIVCCGVFLYFPDLDYARRVLDEFKRAAPVALVLDVPDLATREEAQRARAAAGSKPGEHLYYPRAFFEGSKVWTNNVPGYGNGPFRFNALLDFRGEPT
jgi:SAM-dependent methyltransferase